MADQSIQERPPLPSKKRNNSTDITCGSISILATYKKFSSSFPTSTSSQDLRHFDMERERNKSSSSREATKACEEGSKHENEATKTNSSCTDQKVLSTNKPARSSGWERFFKSWKKRSMSKIPSIRRVVVPNLLKGKSLSARENVDRDRDRFQVNSDWKTFSLADLQMATFNFSKRNIIGKGGFAEVYKGCLPNGQLCAVKRLNRGTSEEERSLNFLCEVGIIAHLNHPNTAKMIGYGVEGGTFLVLELSSLGSLGTLLHGYKEKLDWDKRYKIILGISDGLLYLHENCERRIIHRDIKADNILLSEDYEPQICDFGISKWLPDQLSHHNALKFEGTIGYLAPEYFSQGVVDEKTDVYSFGVLLLEIITRKQALDASRRSLVLWAKPLLQNHEVKELVDASLGDDYNSEEMDRVLATTTMCIHDNPALRPRMSQVTKLLRGIDREQTSSNRQRKQHFKRTYSEELSYVHEYNSTKYLVNYNNQERISIDS